MDSPQKSAVRATAKKRGRATAALADDATSPLNDGVDVREGTEWPGVISLLGLEKLSVPKTSDVLAERLRHLIFSGELAEGAMLPVERDMTSLTGLSRGSVRDALRGLEAEGLVVTRPGRSGGTFVRRPDASTFERNLNILMNGKGITLGDLVDARAAVEPATAGLAARNRTEEDLAALDETSQTMREAISEIRRFQEVNVKWHLAIVAATHNEIMQAYVGSLWRVLARATYVAYFHDRETLLETLIVHDAIVGAIRAGDEHQAQTAMSRHTNAYRDEIYRHNLSQNVLADLDGLAAP